MVNAEQERVQGFGRLENGLRQASDWYLWGPYVSERQWGTVREDYSADGYGLGLLPARPRPVPGLPVGRGRPGRVQRHRAAALPGPGAVERPGPDPEGAAVRADRAGGQPRRGRQGVLVVPGRACPATPGTAGVTTTRRAAFPYDDLVPENGRRDQLPARIRAARHRRVRRRPVLDRRRQLRQGRPDRPADDRPGHQRRAGRRRPCTCCRPPGSATPGPGMRARPSRP